MLSMILKIGDLVDVEHRQAVVAGVKVAKKDLKTRAEIWLSPFVTSDNRYTVKMVSHFTKKLAVSLSSKFRRISHSNMQYPRFVVEGLG